jgi:hypothetical protein
MLYREKSGTLPWTDNESTRANTFTAESNQKVFHDQVTYLRPYWEIFHKLDDSLFCEGM